MKRAAAGRRRQERTTMKQDPHEERCCQHEALIYGLDRLWLEQHEFNRQQLAIHERLAITQARIEALLARLSALGDTGQEA